MCGDRPGTRRRGLGSGAVPGVAEGGVKRNEIVSFAETWIHLKMVIQNEVSQREKNKYCIISLICGI